MKGGHGVLEHMKATVFAGRNWSKLWNGNSSLRRRADIKIGR